MDHVIVLEHCIQEQDQEILRLRHAVNKVGLYAQHIRCKQKDDCVSLKVIQLWLQEVSRDVEEGCCACEKVKAEGSNANPIIVDDGFFCCKIYFFGLSGMS